MKFLQSLFKPADVAAVEQAQSAPEQSQPHAASLATFEGQKFILCFTGDDLCQAIKTEGRGILRLPAVTYGSVLGELKFQLEKEFSDQPRYASDLFASPLVCAGCLWQFPPSYCLSLQSPDLFGGPLVGATTGFDSFGRTGLCPQCGSDEALLVYEFFPCEEVSQADVDALCRYWRAAAEGWWEHTQRQSAICDECNRTVSRGEGYLKGSHLSCESCLSSGLKSDGLARLKSNPHYYGAGLLRKVRRFQG
jgi:hypothetical protein